MLVVRSSDGTALFEDVLALFESLVPVSASCFYQVAESRRAFGHVLRGIDYESLPAYNANYSSLDPCHPKRHARSSVRVITLEKIIPAAHLERSAYFQEFMKPLQMYYEAEVFFRRNGVILAGVSLIRSRSFGPFSREELKIIDGAAEFIERLIAERLFLPVQDECDDEDDTGLTSRERDVIGLVCSGLTNVQIAETLGIKLPTVKSHLQNIFSKVEVTSRTGLIVKMSRGEQRQTYPKAAAQRVQASL